MPDKILPRLSESPARGIIDVIIRFRAKIMVLLLSFAAGLILAVLHIVPILAIPAIVAASAIIIIRFYLSNRLFSAVLSSGNPGLYAILAYIGGWLLLILALVMALFLEKKTAIAFAASLALTEVYLLAASLFSATRRKA